MMSRNRDEVKKILEYLSEVYAEVYMQKYVFKKGKYNLKLLLTDPYVAFKYVLEKCFARRGAENVGGKGYNGYALKALEKLVSDKFESFEYFISTPDASEQLWKEFAEELKRENIGLNERFNKGVIKGIVKMAWCAEDYNYNVILYIRNKLINDPCEIYVELLRIKGIGKKIASFILRDVASICNIENEIFDNWKFLLQPVDIWVARIARTLWFNKLDENELRSLYYNELYHVIAQRITIKCLELGCSPLKFNQGAWTFPQILKSRRSNREILRILSDSHRMVNELENLGTNRRQLLDLLEIVRN